jgi:hypothetical protein
MQLTVSMRGALGTSVVNGGRCHNDDGDVNHSSAQLTKRSKSKTKSSASPTRARAWWPCVFRMVNQTPPPAPLTYHPVSPEHFKLRPSHPRNRASAYSRINHPLHSRFSKISRQRLASLTTVNLPVPEMTLEVYFYQCTGRAFDW